jgi:beta-lactamase superfamily II metal-dependent hydrolase
VIAARAAVIENLNLMKNLPRSLFAALGLAGLALVARADQKTKTLDVYWIDSEGGGSTLIVTPNDEALLIDAGNPGGRDSGRIVAAAKAAGLTKIDYLALTHYHIDHFGGAAEVAKEIPIGTIFQRAIPEGDPDGPRPTPPSAVAPSPAAGAPPAGTPPAGGRGGRGGPAFFQNMIQPWKEIPARREALAPGVIIPLKAVTGGPKLEVRVLAADKKMVEPTPEQLKAKNPLTGTGQPKELAPTDNDNSAVFLVSFGGFRFFDGGDLTWNYEEQLVTPYNRAGVVDVYQTNHHGLDVSNNPVLVKSLSPTVIVMNNGPRKGGMLGAFASLKTVPNVTARYQVHLSLNPNVPAEENAPSEFVANTDSPPNGKNDGNLIKMSVAPDGASYTISVPSTGHSRTYQTKTK